MGNWAPFLVALFLGSNSLLCTIGTVFVISPCFLHIGPPPTLRPTLVYLCLGSSLLVLSTAFVQFRSVSQAPSSLNLIMRRRAGNPIVHPSFWPSTEQLNTFYHGVRATKIDQKHWRCTYFRGGSPSAALPHIDCITASLVLFERAPHKLVPR